MKRLPPVIEISGLESPEAKEAALDALLDVWAKKKVAAELAAESTNEQEVPA